ncbi:MAG: endopeptidase La [Clostridia bacterium]|nr:endopeptidase La [Clostridia bacterium]
MDEIKETTNETKEEITIEKTLYKVVTIRKNVLFPSQVMTVDLGRDKSLAGINAIGGVGTVVVLSQKDKSLTNPTPNDLYRVGTLARIRQISRMPNDITKVIFEGIKRVVVSEFTAFSPYIECVAEDYGVVISEESTEVTALKNLIVKELEDIVKLQPKAQQQNLPDARLDTSNTQKLIANMAYAIYDTDQKRQRLLEVNSEIDQLNDIYAKSLSAKEIFEAEKNIAQKVRNSVEKNQKEYYLREQIKAIHEELGDDEKERELFEKTAKEKGLPDYAVQKLEKELARMDKMAPNSPEAGVIRTYIEWLLDMPWNTYTADSINLDTARKVLDEDHFGLEKIKERIVEYLAVHSLTQSPGGAILCFVGPPGVGKTSIVSSIARAANRKLVQMSLGGVRDEAEVRGHRRTYIGAMPGRILTGMKNAGVNNPVFLLDEIDKMSSDFRGDPASAMLEVLDPNQNGKFMDHYLEIPYDLSKTMFVATANSIDSIPQPLLDRMEVIFLSGYTYTEKLEIAKRYLLPKQTEKNGLKKGQVIMDDETLMDVITLYTKESGVRNLERKMADVVRKIAVKIVDGGDVNATYTVTKADLPEVLGAPKYRPFEKRTEDSVGLVKGLAWTSVGGVTLDVETNLIPSSKGELMLTGQMGDVMKESARIALSVTRALAKEYNIAPELFKENDVHIHIPEGATPKDGPSAGITLTTSLISAFANIKVRSDVAMTGEITLRGRVLAIGGLKEKSLAAFMSGVKTLIIPKENEKDIADIPQEVKDALEIVTVSDIHEVLSVVLAR